MAAYFGIVVAIFLFGGNVFSQELYNLIYHGDDRGLIYDLKNYLYLYDSLETLDDIIRTNSTEPIFIIIQLIGKFFGLNFYQFRFIVILICYWIIFSTAKKLSGNLNLMIALYLMYPIFLDISQFRNFIGIAVFIYASRYLVCYDDAKSKFKFIILMFIAALIHNSIIFYVLFVFIRPIKKARTVKTLAIFGLLISVIAVANNNKLPFINDILLLFADNRKVVKYFSTTTRFGFLIPWFLHIMDFCLIYWGRRLYYNRNDNEMTVQRRVINFCYYINVFLFLYFPVFICNIQFYRILKNVFILNFIFFSIVLRSIKNKKNEYYLYLLFIIVSVLIWTAYDISGRLDMLFISPFEVNYFFDLLN